MARGRFISNDVIADKEIHNLSTDTSRLAYIFLITIADCEGRAVGDPIYLASLLFPRRREITPDMITAFIIEWIKAGFIVWYYNDDGEKAIQLVNWEKHQKGLRKDREAPTEFADPDGCQLVEYKETVKDNENNKSKFKLNGKSVLTPDLVQPKSGNGQGLLEYFIQETGIIPPSENLQPKEAINWEREIRVWENKGITKENVLAAIKKLDDNNLSVSWPGSLTKTIISNISKQKRGVSTDDKSANDYGPAPYPEHPAIIKAADGFWYNSKTGERVEVANG